MNRLVQNPGSATASNSRTWRHAIVFSPVDYGLLAMLLVTLVSIGVTIAGN